MVQPEDRIKCGIVKVVHMATHPSHSVYRIVDGFETVGVDRVTVHPCFVSKLCEVGVSCEEIVQAIPERNLIVYKDRRDEVVLAQSFDGPIGWISLGNSPDRVLMLHEKTASVRASFKSSTYWSVHHI